MDVTTKLLILILCMVIVPVMAGTLLTHFMKEKDKNLLVCYCAGTMLSWTVFQGLVLPMIFLEQKFHLLIYAYCMIMFLLSIIGLWIARKDLKGIIRNTYYAGKKFPRFFLLVLLVIVLQTAISVYFEHIDEDDAFYVATAVVTEDTDTMFMYNPYTGDEFKKLPARYVLSPLPIFMALVAKISGLHPTMVAHTFAPAFLIPLAYMVYLLVGNRLLKGNKKSLAVFLLLLSFLMMFGNGSIYTTETFLLYRIWQGKSILAAILIPLLFYVIPNTMDEKDTIGDWLFLFSTMTAASMVSSMGIFLSLVELGLLTFLYSFKNKRLSYLFYGILCSIPCLIGGMMYLLIK